MNSRSRFCVLASVALGILPGAGLFAQLETEVEYDLRSGSSILDGCLNCNRKPIERPLEGSFRLRVVNFGDVITQYEILDLLLASPAEDYRLAGSGTYDTWLGEPGSQAMAIDLVANDVAGVKLASDMVEIAVPYRTPWPIIDISVTEPGDRDPAHQYTVRIVAALKTKLVRYELQDESYLVDDCTICGRPAYKVKIKGSFFLGEIDGAPNPIATYRVDDIQFEGVRGTSSTYTVTGAGLYRQGGEVALLQEMRLEVDVNEALGNLLESPEPASPPVTFPAIEIDLTQKNPPGLIVYSLHLIASPGESSQSIPFRRAEVNGDGKVDISDAVSLLAWLFLGGASPPCLEGADANDDGNHDVSDAVFTLLYLFQGGAEPPAPGPVDCGTVPEPHLGCAAYACG